MKKILVAHRGEPGKYRQQLSDAGIELPDEGIVEATNVAEIRQAFETEDIEVMVTTSTSKQPFELTKMFMEKIEPYFDNPVSHDRPRVLIVNTGHYLSKEHANQLIDNNFPLDFTRPVYAETLEDAIQFLETEEIDIFLAATSSHKLRREMALVTKMMASARGIDTISANGITLDRTTRVVTVDGKIVKLSKTEAQILVIFLARPGMPLGSEYLLYRIWDSEDPNENYLVRSAIKRLRKKIEPDPSNPCYLQTVGGSYMLNTCKKLTRKMSPDL